MPNYPDFELHVGRNIREFCGNGKTGDEINHCAHYSCHALELDVGYDCKEWTGGSAPGAGVRVNEVFMACPLVGAWEEDAPADPCLFFVTHPSNVNLSRKWMGTSPKKHVGILSGQHIFHYNNDDECVVKQTVPDFQAYFERRYGRGQGHYTGTIPGSDLRLKVDAEGRCVRQGKAFCFSPPKKRDYYAKAEGEPEFYVGRDMRYGSRRGIGMRVQDYYGPRYQAADYAGKYDHWAVLMDLIAKNESQGCFNLVNAYDSAGFTFGFYQLAAHTPGENLVLLFRRLLELPEAAEYLPELALRNGRVHRVDERGGATDLETGMRFKAYLNPDQAQVDDQELLHAARLIHWANNSEDMRDVQVDVAADILIGKVDRIYAPWYDMDGMIDTHAAIICDVHHQGRAKKPAVLKALADPQPEEALLRLGQAKQQQRVANLRANVAAMKSAGQLGRKVYQRATNSFVDA